MSKMKGLPGYLKTLAIFSLLFNITAEGVQVPTPDELLDQKEKELTDFVATVQANARNCDALEGCSRLEGGCSREACFRYGTEHNPNYKCLDVAFNNVCVPSCSHRNFDFNRSFVRRVDTQNEYIGRTVCTHRTLDNHFRNSSMNDSTHLFRVFFGAIDGTTRLYPGLDEVCINSYDCRLRPWFIESTYVPKFVTLLVDSGPSMQDKPAAADPKGETYLTHAKTTALEVLGTLQPDLQDYVNIMCFDGHGIKQPNATPVKYDTTLNQKFNDTLNCTDNSVSPIDPNATAIASAINAAMSKMGTDSEDYLKVVIVLTRGGRFNVSSPSNLSLNTGVNLFVYNFPTADGARECNASIRASSETIPVERMDNPLYALESYFSFLAKVHRNYMRNQTDYGTKYTDASGIDTSTMTISKAAFGPNGELLGVVGIDFFETKVHEQYSGLDFTYIVNAARKRNPTGPFNALVATLPSVCFNDTEACPGLQNTNIDGLCGIKDGDAKIGCCGACKHKKRPWGAILGGMVGAVAGLFGVATALYCLRHRIARTQEEQPTSQDQPYSGSDDDTT